MKESITRRRQAPSIAKVGSTCNLNLKIPGETSVCSAGIRTSSRLLPPHLLLCPCFPPSGNWFHMVSAQECLTRTFTRSSHTYTRTERTEISKTRAGETKREVRVEESTQVGDPFRDVFGNFMGRDSLSGFNGSRQAPPPPPAPPLQDCGFRSSYRGKPI